MSNIAEKAMLVNLSISQWTARKYDKSISAQIESEYKAHDAGRYNKILIAQEEIKKIQKIANKARTLHYEYTLPWGDNNDRVLPSKMYLDYVEKIRSIKADFDKIVDSFCKNYPALIDEARKRLNGMFKESDYPDVYSIKHKYNFDFHVKPIETPNDFRVSLNDSEIATIKKDIEDRINKQQDEAMRDLWFRLYEKVEHMAEKLNNEDALFRDSLVGNIVELCQMLPKLNITNDPKLEKMRQEVESHLTQYEPDVLRHNTTVRRNTVEKANDILKKMSGYIN